MANEHEVWLDQVRAALHSINMSMDDWQPLWPFDFLGEHDKGTDPNAAAKLAVSYDKIRAYRDSKHSGR